MLSYFSANEGESYKAINWPRSQWPVADSVENQSGPRGLIQIVFETKSWYKLGNISGTVQMNRCLSYAAFRD